jgi:hypothetical protein
VGVIVLERFKVENTHSDQQPFSFALSKDDVALALMSSTPPCLSLSPSLILSQHLMATFQGITYSVHIPDKSNKDG